jgi:hypothetical protein
MEFTNLEPSDWDTFRAANTSAGHEIIRNHKRICWVLVVEQIRVFFGGPQLSTRSDV